MHATGIVKLNSACRDVGRVGEQIVLLNADYGLEELEGTAADDNYAGLGLAAESEKNKKREKSKCRRLNSFHSKSYSPPMRGHENKLFEYFLLQAVIGGGSVTVPCIPSG